MMRSTLALLALVSGSLVAAPFSNGSFETPIVTGNTDLAFLVGTPWVYSGVADAQFLTLSGGFGIPAGDGNQYITWGGNGATGGQLSQTFDTTAGFLYTVTYILATQQGGATPPVQSFTAAAFDGAALLASVSNSFNSAAGVWQAGTTLNFVATSSSTILRFTDTSVGAASVNWGLDNVVVNSTEPPPSGGVPEPSTYGLVGLTLGLLAYRRRK
jgi:hypothetical protein